MLHSDHLINQNSNQMQKSQYKYFTMGKKNIKKPVVAIGVINNLNYKLLLNQVLNILHYQVIFGITQI